MSKNERKYPKGYWMSVGVSIGIAIGVAMGPIYDNFGVGIAIGVAIGSGIGASLERRNQDNIRPLTEQERARQKWGIAIGLAVAAILAVFLVIVTSFKVDEIIEMGNESGSIDTIRTYA